MIQTLRTVADQEALIEKAYNASDDKKETMIKIFADNSFDEDDVNDFIHLLEYGDSKAYFYLDTLVRDRIIDAIVEVLGDVDLNEDYKSAKRIVADIYDKSGNILETRYFSNRKQLDSFVDNLNNNLIDMTADNNVPFKDSKGNMRICDIWRITVDDLITEEAKKKKDSNTIRDSIREGETYTNRNGVQIKILGINTDVTGKKYATYRIKNDTYNYPVENVENMLKANHYTKDSTIKDAEELPHITKEQCNRISEGAKKKKELGAFVKLDAGDVEEGNKFFNKTVAGTESEGGCNMSEDLRTINIRDELNKLDTIDYNDLVNMYDCLKLSDLEKTQLAQLLANHDSENAIKFISDRYYKENICEDNDNTAEQDIEVSVSLGNRIKQIYDADAEQADIQYENKNYKAWDAFDKKWELLHLLLVQYDRHNRRPLEKVIDRMRPEDQKQLIDRYLKENLQEQNFDDNMPE